MSYYDGVTAQAENAYAGAAKLSVALPELGRIKLAAERIARLRSNVECFLGRFNGVSECLGEGSFDERDSNYRNDISALFEQIERLEKVVSQLGEIG